MPARGKLPARGAGTSRGAGTGRGISTGRGKDIRRKSVSSSRSSRSSYSEEGKKISPRPRAKGLSPRPKINVEKASRVPSCKKHKSRYNKEEYKEWLRENVIEIIADSSEIDDYLNDTSMLEWEKAITHETIDYENSYEILEKIGDGILKTLITDLMIKRYGRLTPRDISSLSEYYQSNVFFAELAEKMGIVKYIRAGGYGSDHGFRISADVFEACFGACYTISGQIVPEKAQYKCKLLLEHIMKDVEFDKTKMGGSIKSRVLELFAFHNFSGRNSLAPRELLEAYEENAYMAIYFLPSTVNFFARRLDELWTKGKIRIIPNDEAVESMKNSGYSFYSFAEKGSVLVGYGDGETKEEASLKAYTMVWKYLDDLGITAKWAKKVKLLTDINSEEIKPAYELITEKLEADGYHEIEFAAIPKLSTGAKKVIMLLGHTYEEVNGEKVLKKVTLAEATGTQNVVKTKVALLDMYSRGEKSCDIRSKGK